jgi:hypothetical protein
MPSLVDLQTAMGRALLANDAADRALPEAWFEGEARAGLKVHRNTIVGAYCQALRLSYPTLERVLGAPMFENLAAEFARAHPPQSPSLDTYGEAFADFVAGRAAVSDAALLCELGHFDWIFECVAHSRAGQFKARPAVLLEGGTTLRLADSLQLFHTYYAVDAMRAGIASSIAPDELRHLALWHRSQGVAVQELRAPAAAFVSTLLQGAALDAALLAATAALPGDEASVARSITSEVFQSGFVHLSQGANEHGIHSNQPD